MKGGEWLIKEIAPEDIFTPSDLDEESRMMADVAHEFIEKEIWPHVEDIDKQKPGLVQELLDKAGEMGLLGTALPEKYGGLGKGFNTNTAISVAIGKSNSFGVSLAAHTGIGTLPILYYGTEAQRQQYLPKLATGELKAAYCLTEPGSGSDALAARTKAELSEDGNHYLLTGQKMWITNGGFADLFIVFAQISGDNLPDDKQGFSAFIVSADSEGLKRGDEERKMGIKGSSTTQIFFDNVKVPKENLLGDAGKGAKIAFNILNIGRFKLCAMVVGGAITCLNRSVQYANERQQFGQAISGFGAIQHKLAEQAILIFATESATYRVSDLIRQKGQEMEDAGSEYSEALMGAAEEYAIECAMLKVLGSEMLDYVVDEMVQIYGGYGYSEEYPAARAYRDSRINRIFEGTNEINRLLTVDMLMKRALKGQLDLMGPAKAVQAELMSIPDFGESDESPFAAELKAIANTKKAILMVAGAAAQKLMQDLEKEQEIIMDITDMMIKVFAAESALLRTMKRTGSSGEDESSPYMWMTQVYLSDALEQINLCGKHAIAAFTHGDEQRMMLMGLKRFTKFKIVNTVALRRKIAGKLIESGKWVF
ncbi:MAG: acyl-CoA dehydrogenase family protein [Bacteroidia bacterium]